MQFRTIVVASAALAVAQAVEFTVLTFATITAGQPFQLTWTDADAPVTILLKNGPPGNLQTVSTIASGLTGESFTWNVPATLAADTYALEIRDGTTDADANYSTQFELIGGVRSSTTGTVSRTSTGTSSSTGTVSSASVTSSDSSSATASTASGSTTSTLRTTSSRTTSSPTSSTTSTGAPAGGMASGLTSNLALVFGAVGALFLIN